MPSLESRNNLKSKEQEICANYIGGESSNAIAKKLYISKSSVKKILKKHNILIRNASISHKIYNCDESIFEIIDSHEKAYWVGFLTADATITNGSLKLALAIKDYTHLEKFKIFMKSDHKIYMYQQIPGENSVIKNKSKKYYYGIISIHSSKIINDLDKYSITPKKSFTTQFGKNIPNEFINSYMLGLIDADGFITVSNNKITIGFLSHNNFAQTFKHILKQNVELPDNKLLNHHTNENLKIVRFSGQKVLKIGDFLYKNTPIYLDRKRNRILNFFQII